MFNAYDLQNAFVTRYGNQEPYTTQGYIYKYCYPETVTVMDEQYNEFEFTSVYLVNSFEKGEIFRQRAIVVDL